MAAHRGRRRRSHDEHAEHENEERWLISYADMVTLLMCLFMVLFSISSVNTSKWDALSKSLNEAFSGQILSGGKSIQQTGASSDHTEKATPEPPIPAIQPVTSNQTSDPGEAKAQAAKEQTDFEALKEQVKSFADQHGLKGKLDAQVADRGLVIRLLTDGVLFDSGSSQLKPTAAPVLKPIAKLLASEVRHPIGVEGHTDDRPISSARFPDNWELSTSRATSVVRFLIGGGVSPKRLEAAGVADERPVTANDSDADRARNRRVEIVLQRQSSTGGQGGHP